MIATLQTQPKAQTTSQGIRDNLVRALDESINNLERLSKEYKTFEQSVREFERNRAPTFVNLGNTIFIRGEPEGEYNARHEKLDKISERFHEAYKEAGRLLSFTKLFPNTGIDFVVYQSKMGAINLRD